MLVKDKLAKQVTMQEKRHNDLYMLKDVTFKAFYFTRQHQSTEQIWHQWIGHPNMDIL